MPVSRRPTLVLLAALVVALTGCLHLGGPVFDARDDSWMPLHDAALAGDVAGLRAALGAGAEVDAPTGHGDTALMLACRGGDRAAVELLLERGASVAEQNKAKFDPLEVAVAYGHGHLLALLFEHGATTEVGFLDTVDPLQVAVLGGRVEVLDELLRLAPKAMAKRVENRMGVLEMALLGRAAPPAIQASLKAAGVDLGAEARARDERQMMGLLMLLALLRGDRGLAEAAFAMGVDPNLPMKDDSKGGGTLLHAIAATPPAKLKPVEVAPADRDPVGAARRGAGAATVPGPAVILEVVEFMLAHGADPTVPDANGKTAIELAREAGKDDLWMALRMGAAGRAGAARKEAAPGAVGAPPERPDSR